MPRPSKNPLHSPLLKALTVALLLCAFGAAWTHVHALTQEQDPSHTCLLCQWAGTPASTVDSPAVLVSLQVLGYLSPFSDLEVFQTFRNLLRSRSPPSISFS